MANILKTGPEHRFYGDTHGFRDLHVGVYSRLGAEEFVDKFAGHFAMDIYEPDKLLMITNYVYKYTQAPNSIIAVRRMTLGRGGDNGYVRKWIRRLVVFKENLKDYPSSKVLWDFE